MMKEFEEFKGLLRADRTVRRFDGGRRAECDDLRRLVELTRYCSSGRNLQPLRYRIVSDPGECARVYPLLKWAGYLTDWDGPAPSERPTAYLVQCLDTELTGNCLCGDGLQLQAITLGARALGIGACIIKSFNAPALVRELSLPAVMRPLYVVALGYPVERVEIDDMAEGGEDIKYYRTADGVHHVPKRPLNDLLI